MADQNANNKSKPLKGAVTLRLGDILHDSDGLLTLVKLNFLFMITCLPVIPPVAVFTAGPALKALTHCTNELVRTGYLPETKNKYMAVFKKDMAKSVKAGTAVVIFSLLFIFGLYFYLVMSGGNMFYIPFASFSLFMLMSIWGISAHLFPALTEKEDEDFTFKELFSLAVNMLLANLTKTLVAVVISGIMLAALVLFLPASLPLVLTVGFSVPALCCAFAHTEPEFT